MRASDGGTAAAVPARLLTAGTSIRAVGTEVGDLPQTLSGVAGGTGSAAATAALAGLLRASTGALDRLGEQVQLLAVTVEAAAQDFRRADGH